MQPLAALPAGVAVPTGVAVTKVVSIEVFDAGTGDLIHDHASKPLALAIQLTDDEKAVCQADPRRIALLHIDAAGKVTRISPINLDCATGVLYARLPSTSTYAVAKLTSSMAVTIRLFVPASPRNRGGW